MLLQANKLTVTTATAEMHHPPSHWAHIHCLVSLNFSIDECQWVTFFAHGGIQFHIRTSYETPLHQTVPLLPSVTQQQHVMEYWWEGSTSAAVPPTSASNVVGQPINT